MTVFKAHSSDIYQRSVDMNVYLVKVMRFFHVNDCLSQFCCLHEVLEPLFRLQV